MTLRTSGESVNSPVGLSRGYSRVCGLYGRGEPRVGTREAVRVDKVLGIAARQGPRTHHPNDERARGCLGSGRRYERAHERGEAVAGAAVVFERVGPCGRHGDLEAISVLASATEGGIASTMTRRPVPHAGQRSGSLPTMRE